MMPTEHLLLNMLNSLTSWTIEDNCLVGYNRVTDNREFTIVWPASDVNAIHPDLFQSLLYIRKMNGDYADEIDSDDSLLRSQVRHLLQPLSVPYQAFSVNKGSSPRVGWVESFEATTGQLRECALSVTALWYEVSTLALDPFGSLHTVPPFVTKTRRDTRWVPASWLDSQYRGWYERLLTGQTFDLAGTALAQHIFKPDEAPLPGASLPSLLLE